MIQVLAVRHGLPGGCKMFFPGVAQLSDTDRHLTMRNSKIRHASMNGLMACLIEAACRECLVDVGMPLDQVGLLCNGGPWNLDSASRFLERALDAGPEFVNPLSFPATLVSATPCAVAAAVGAHAFAYSLGHDELAFFDVLRRARQYLDFGHARTVVAVGACTGNATLNKARESAGLSREVLDVSIGFLLASSLDTNCDLVLVDADIGSNANPWAGVLQRYEAIYNSGVLEFSIALSCSDGDSLTAIGAILCAAAIARESEVRSDTFVVTCTKGGVTGGALFRRMSAAAP
jgi:hypothetical protein